MNTIKKPPKKAISGNTLEIHFGGAYGEALRGECRLCDAKFYTSLNPATAIEEIETQYRDHLLKNHAIAPQQVPRSLGK